MLKPVILMLLPLLLLPPNGSINSENQATPYTDPEAYAVYAAVLPREWTWEAAKASKLIIRIETQTYKMCLVPEKGEEKIYETAIADFVKQNEKTWLLQQNFKIEKEYDLASAEEIKTLMNGGWKKFYERRPGSGGWISFSAVGFNAEKTVAVVYIAHYFGNLCAGGHFQVLRKINGEWQVVNWMGMSCGWNS